MSRRIKIIISIISIFSRGFSRLCVFQDPEKIGQNLITVPTIFLGEIQDYFTKKLLRISSVGKGSFYYYLTHLRVFEKVTRSLLSL